MSCWCHVDVMVMLLFLISYLRSIKFWAVLEPKSFWTHLKSPPGCEWGPWWRDCRDCVLEHFGKETGKILCTVKAVKWMGRSWREINRNTKQFFFVSPWCSSSKIIPGLWVSQVPIALLASHPNVRLSNVTAAGKWVCLRRFHFEALDGSCREMVRSPRDGSVPHILDRYFREFVSANKCWVFWFT